MLPKNQTCCFTGHRTIETAKLPAIKRCLENIIDMLIAQGIVYYHCGGALGFDTLAGFTVLDLKKKYPAVKLIMVLPCRDQDAKWTQKEKTVYRELLSAADKTVYTSEEYHEGCMKKRNMYLVEMSGYCIAYLNHGRSGTGQTVRLAKERGLTVLNIYGMAKHLP